MTDTIALIVAGGSGSRFGEPTPKQYLPLAGRAVLRHTVEAFRREGRIDAIRVVIRDGDQARYHAALADLGADSRILEPVVGGADRQASVKAGLDSLPDAAAVLIHDAARPLVDTGTITRTLDALAHHDGAIAGLPVVDALWRARDGRIDAAVPRDGLWRAQTPQTFRLDAIRDAHRRWAGAGLADDAAVAAQSGLDVALTFGAADNIKITTPDDLAWAEQRLLARLADIRVGSGFDVHKFGPGTELMLCGVPVAHAQGLVGHSDADVGLHALTDAILGAIGAGDIGQHFPPSDPRWRGAESAQFLAHAAGLVAQRGGIIAHVDVTVICERPKVGPHRAAMVQRIAEILQLAPDRVSVKATTTEELGFTGRREGIAAQATATVRLP